MTATTSRPDPDATPFREPAAPAPRPASYRAARRRRPLTAVQAAATLAVLASIYLRFVSSGPLWLDEAISNEIARRHLGAMFRALRHDGSPPLYYLLLHGWIAVFGDSTTAVRTLSSVISLCALPLAWRIGKEIGGRRLAGPLLLVTASTPWVLRYSTETRMYQLVFVEVLAGILLLTRIRREPTRARLLQVTLLTAALAYTHYWTFFLLGPVALWLLWRRQWAVFGAMAASVILFAPWLPSFYYQVKNTGTPWADPANLKVFESTLIQWGGAGTLGSLLAVVMIPLAFLGTCALTRPARGGALALRPTGAPGVRAFAAFAAAPLLVVMLLGSVLHTGYAVRYTAVCLPFYLLLLARGLSVLPGQALRGIATTVVVVAGLFVGRDAANSLRTQAGSVAAALRASAQPGDVVAYCPDQLGPAVHRLLPASLGLREIVYADPSGPALVDWVNYVQRVHATAPASFAQQVLKAAGTHHDVWLIAQDGYRVYGGDCSQVFTVLASVRGVPTIAVGSNGSIFEHATLARFPGSS